MEFDGHPLTTLRDRLRNATAAAHERVEQAIAYDEVVVSLDAYRRALGVLYASFVTAQRALVAIDWHGAPPDLTGVARKLDWLRDDLAALGDEAPACIDRRLDIRTAGHGAGCLYVIEGSALGGRVIFKRAGAALPITAQRGGRFYDGDGDDTARVWTGFLKWLDAIPVRSVMADDAVYGADATFEMIERIADARQPT